MTEVTMKGALTIAPGAACDDDQAVLDEVRARNVELTNRLAHKDQVLKAAAALVQQPGELDTVLLLGILSQ